MLVLHLTPAQGESTPHGLLSLVDSRDTFSRTSLARVLYHSLFDIAGAECTAANVRISVVRPVFVGMARTIDALLDAVFDPTGDKSGDELYSRLLHASAPPAVQAAVASLSADNRLAALRVCALTRNMVSLPELLVSELCKPELAQLRAELAGQVGAAPHILLYYSPDLMRLTLVPTPPVVGAGEEAKLAAGRAVEAVPAPTYSAALLALQFLFAKVRVVLPLSVSKPKQHDASVGSLVTRAKVAGWTGEDLLRLVRDHCRYVSSRGTEGYFIIDT